MASFAVLFGLSVLVCGQALLRDASPQTRFIDIPLLSEKDVDKALQVELKGSQNKERIEAIESALRLIYDSLPKTTNDGRLGIQTVRYVLHRFFLNQRGWLIKGLEPQGNSWEFLPNETVKDWQGWVPSYLQQRFGAKDSFDLKELVAMAATIEDLVRQEASRQLEEVYEVLGLDHGKPQNQTNVQEVLDMYLMIYVTSRNLTIADPATQRKRLEIFSRKYTGFKEVHQWLDEVEKHHKITGQDVPFSTVEELVQEMGEQYPAFNDQECLDLKKVMIDMEGGSRKPGRIPLADFYNKSKVTHWRFTESPEYLRSLGALDESDPKRPQVIVSNYVSSFNNCLRATEMYAVCCRSECETLMGSLEKDIQQSSARPEKIADLVAKMSTSTVAARGNLDKKLLSRLQDVATANKGEVQLHGRLFAQWMHHAFPRECPYPHEAGTTNPQTPDEWLRVSGQGTQASKDRIEQIIQESCPASGFRPAIGPGSEASPCGAEEVSELPWSNTEELLEKSEIKEEPSAQGQTAQAKTTTKVTRSTIPRMLCLFLVLAVLAGAALAVTFFDKKRSLTSGVEPKVVVAALSMIAITAMLTALDVVSPAAVVGATVVFGIWRYTTVHVNVCVPLHKEVWEKSEKSMV
eukprot:TRINITY_DN48631_c0_g1_i1.p1 TRINITY_DN48631_c0_g1~~TRINITY_DN48631_c0_g1_i1.p1  ORF type:complete len:634 (+),score=144.99 TRINITY_DN48631_c0_g1_i1:90-1991(+)